MPLWPPEQFLSAHFEHFCFKLSFFDQIGHILPTVLDNKKCFLHFFIWFVFVTLLLSSCDMNRVKFNNNKCKKINISQKIIYLIYLYIILYLPGIKDHFQKRLPLWPPELFSSAHFQNFKLRIYVFSNTYPDLHHLQGVMKFASQISTLLLSVYFLHLPLHQQILSVIWWE